MFKLYLTFTGYSVTPNLDPYVELRCYVHSAGALVYKDTVCNFLATTDFKEAIHVHG